MKFEVSPNKFINRIIWNLLEGCGAILFLCGVLMYGLISNRIDWTVGVIIGGVAVIFIYLTWKSINSYNSFITRIDVFDKYLIIGFAYRDRTPNTEEFLLSDTNITFSSQGKGGAYKFLHISSNTKTISQIVTGDWNTKLFVEVFLNFKEVKKENLTYDEQDWIERLNK